MSAPASTTVNAPRGELHLPALLEYRAAAAQRRAAAFCAVPYQVLGTPVRQMTPATFSLLLASGNRFIVGGTPTEKDVRGFLWFHSALNREPGTWLWSLRKWFALDRLTTHFTQPFRRWLGLRFSVDLYIATLALATAEIRTLIADDFADAPRALGRAVAPVATLEAQLIHEAAENYHWAAERTRRTPLRQLFQLNRCICRAAGENVRDAGEDEILALHLRRRNAALAALREAAKTP